MTGESPEVVIGPVIEKREKAISYVLEDACIHFGYLASRRPQRNVKLAERQLPKPINPSKDKDKYSHMILSEFRANYTGDAPLSDSTGMLEVQYIAVILFHAVE